MNAATVLRFGRPPRWRRVDVAGEPGVEVWDEARGRWQRVKPWTAPILDALAAGIAYDALVTLARRVPVSKDPVKAELRLKLFLFTLFRLGHLDLPRPPTCDGAQARYRTVRELGRGGVAVADLCVDARSGEEVVVKRAWDFLQGYAVTEDAIRREDEVLAALDHPRIVRPRDRFEADGHLHLVRDFVAGEDLLAFRARGPPREPALRRIAADLIDILEHIHERGFLLLDLRPANFFVTAEGRAFLVDVGQCRRHTAGRLSLGRKVGSRGFMAPEMRDREEASTASDVYGLGLLLLFLRTGDLPRAPPSAAAIEAALAGDPWQPVVLAFTRPVHDGRPATPAEARRLLQRMPPVIPS